MSDLRLWHGGVPDLKVGDLIGPGYDRKSHPGCPYCAAREREAAGGPHAVLDGLARHRDKVYLTTNREYARHYASLWGRGDLYRVEPVGDLTLSTEDTIETYVAFAARVLAVYERAVLLTMKQRRTLVRRWAEADHKAGLP